MRRSRTAVLAAVLLAVLATACSPAPAADGRPPVAERPAQTGIYGNLHLPAGPGPYGSAVLVLSGAEGGLTVDPLAAALARDGHPALALAYFGLPGVPELPATLTAVPLEYFATALRLLAATPGVDPARVDVWGISRGSEAAQLVAVAYPDLVHDVVADSPSSVVHAASSDGAAPAWTLAGHPVAWVPAADAATPDPVDAREAVIPDQDVRGRILTICGGQDRLWPACPFSEAIAARARLPVTRLVYPDAGHSFVSLHLQGAQAPGVAARMAAAGGTPEANTDAAVDAFAKVLIFLAAP